MSSETSWVNTNKVYFSKIEKISGKNRKSKKMKWNCESDQVNRRWKQSSMFLPVLDRLATRKTTETTKSRPHPDSSEVPSSENGLNNRRSVSASRGQLAKSYLSLSTSKRFLKLRSPRRRWDFPPRSPPTHASSPYSSYAQVRSKSITLLSNPLESFGGREKRAANFAPAIQSDKCPGQGWRC